MTAGKLIFIQQKRASRFINRQGGWVPEFDEAANFESMMEAADFCFKKCVRGAEIVLRMGEPTYDVKIDVNCAYPAILKY